MKIAVIGAGVAGIGAALALSKSHDVQLFEQDARFGGHANTVDVDHDGRQIAVDTGFIVYNEKNYPNLCGFFDSLGVATETSDMSFGVSLNSGRLEYACDNLDKIFAQRWRALDPSYLRCFADILRFNRQAPRALAAGALEGVALDEWLLAQGYSRQMREYFVMSMGAAIWSTPLADIGRFPARAFVQFFANHELFTGLGPSIQWRTVTGGSREYVSRALRRLGPRAVAGVGAQSVSRLPSGQVRVAFQDGSEGVFDHVVLAVHADQAAALLADASDDERRIVGAVKFSQNVAVLHADASLMPKRRKVWSSWNVLVESGDENVRTPASLTYWMNRLQDIDQSTPLFVTLNPQRAPDPKLTFGTFAYDHPLYDQAGLRRSD